MFTAVNYSDLNPRQKENFNFHKVAAKLADYGFNCLRLNDDWQGADFIACHIDGNSFLKVQLKGRLTIDKKYQKKDIYIAFPHGNEIFVYDHDLFIEHISEHNLIGEKGKKWHEEGSRSWSSPPRWALTFLEAYKI